MHKIKQFSHENKRITNDRKHLNQEEKDTSSKRKKRKEEKRITMAIHKKEKNVSMATCSSSPALACGGPSVPSCASARVLTGLFSFGGESVGEQKPVILCGKAPAMEERTWRERIECPWKGKGEEPRAEKPFGKEVQRVP